MDGYNARGMHIIENEISVENGIFISFDENERTDEKKMAFYSNGKNDHDQHIIFHSWKYEQSELNAMKYKQ